MVRRGCHALKGVFTLTQAQRQEVASRYGIELEKITVVGAGFDDRLFFDRRREDNNEPDERCRLIYGGKLSRAKGIPWLLEALHRLRDYPFHLHLVGSGSGIEHERSLELADRLKNQVTVHGAVSQKELALLMRASHILVLPSLYEGLPLVVLEALACGCRVIATALDGTKEIAEQLNSEHLILLPSPTVIDIDKTILDDEEAFVQRLQEALVSCLSNRSDALPLVDLKHYHWNSVFRRIQTIWRQCSSETA
jgi:glycosyltransferase involved in cell wall biosynthesis